MKREAPIITACKGGDLKALQSILAKENDPGSIATGDQFGWNGAHHAAANGHAEVIEFLFSTSKSLFTSKDVEGCTPANRAAREGMLEVIKVLEPRYGVSSDLHE
jgi:hypothetical protein